MYSNSVKEQVLDLKKEIALMKLRSFSSKSLEVKDYRQKRKTLARLLTKEKK